MSTKMTLSMREQLLARIQPAIEQLAEQMVDMLLARIELHVNQLELAFDAATSAFASDLSVTDGAARRYDVRDEHNGNRRAAQPRSRARTEARVSEGSAAGSLGARVEEHDAAAAADSSSERAADLHDSSNRALQQGQDLPPSTSSSSTVDGERGSGQSAPHETQQGADTPGHRASEAAGNVADPHRVPSGHRDADAADVDTSPRRICGCAARGRHRKDCSLPNISTSPASDPRRPALTTSSPATSPISGLSSAPATSGTSTRSDRFAQIEASRAQRELAKRDRAERARSFIRRDGVRPTRGPAEQPERPRQDAVLPLEPVASFEF